MENVNQSIKEKLNQSSTTWYSIQVMFALWQAIDCSDRKKKIAIKDKKIPAPTQTAPL